MERLAPKSAILYQQSSYQEASITLSDHILQSPILRHIPQLLVLVHQSPALNHLSSIHNHHSSITISRLLILNHQSSITFFDHQSSTDYQPSITSLFPKTSSSFLSSVTDAEMIDSMKFVFQRLKFAIEVSAASGIAAVQGNQFQSIARRNNFKNVGVILCGGNTDLGKLPWIVN